MAEPSTKLNILDALFFEAKELEKQKETETNWHRTLVLFEKLLSLSREPTSMSVVLTNTQPLLIRSIQSERFRLSSLALSFLVMTAEVCGPAQTYDFSPFLPVLLRLTGKAHRLLVSRSTEALLTLAPFISSRTALLRSISLGIASANKNTRYAAYRLLALRAADLEPQASQWADMGRKDPALEVRLLFKPNCPKAAHQNDSLSSRRGTYGSDAQSKGSLNLRVDSLRSSHHNNIAPCDSVATISTARFGTSTGSAENKTGIAPASNKSSVRDRMCSSGQSAVSNIAGSSIATGRHTGPVYNVVSGGERSAAVIKKEDQVPGVKYNTSGTFGATVNRVNKSRDSNKDVDGVGNIAGSCPKSVIQGPFPSAQQEDSVSSHSGRAKNLEIRPATPRKQVKVTETTVSQEQQIKKLEMEISKIASYAASKTDSSTSTLSFYEKLNKLKEKKTWDAAVQDKLTPRKLSRYLEKYRARPGGSENSAAAADNSQSAVMSVGCISSAPSNLAVSQPQTNVAVSENGRSFVSLQLSKGEDFGQQGQALANALSESTRYYFHQEHHLLDSSAAQEVMVEKERRTVPDDFKKTGMTEIDLSESADKKSGIPSHNNSASDHVYNEQEQEHKAVDGAVYREEKEKRTMETVLNEELVGNGVTEMVSMDASCKSTNQDAVCVYELDDHSRATSFRSATDIAVTHPNYHNPIDKVVDSNGCGDASASTKSQSSPLHFVIKENPSNRGSVTDIKESPYEAENDEQIDKLNSLHQPLKSDEKENIEMCSEIANNLVSRNNSEISSNTTKTRDVSLLNVSGENLTLAKDKDSAVYQCASEELILCNTYDALPVTHRSTEGEIAEKCMMARNGATEKHARSEETAIDMEVSQKNHVDGPEGSSELNKEGDERGKQIDTQHLSNLWQKTDDDTADPLIRTTSQMSPEELNVAGYAEVAETVVDLDEVVKGTNCLSYGGGCSVYDSRAESLQERENEKMECLAEDAGSLCVDEPERTQEETFLSGAEIRDSPLSSVCLFTACDYEGDCISSAEDTLDMACSGPHNNSSAHKNIKEISIVHNGLTTDLAEQKIDSSFSSSSSSSTTKLGASSGEIEELSKSLVNISIEASNCKDGDSESVQVMRTSAVYSTTSQADLVCGDGERTVVIGRIDSTADVCVGFHRLEGREGKTALPYTAKKQEQEITTQEQLLKEEDRRISENICDQGKTPDNYGSTVSPTKHRILNREVFSERETSEEQQEKPVFDDTR